MAATVQISESNSSSEIVTDNISTGHYRGGTDSPNAAAVTTDPISPGSNSYEKWHRLKWESGSAIQIDTIRIHRNAGAIPGSTLYHGSQAASTPSNETYSTPVTTASTKADTNIPTSDPAVATINGSLTASGQYSGYWVSQVKTDAGDTDGLSGNQVTWSWREIA